MSWLTNLNSRFKIGTRIGAGYLLVLGLLVVVAGAGYLGLRSASDAFARFTHISDTASRVAQADRDFVALRLNMQMYFDKGDEKLLTRIRELAESVRGGYGFTAETALSQERRDMARTILAQVDQYMTLFDEIAKNQAALRRTIADETTPLGNRLHGQMKELMQGAIADNDLALVSLAGVATEQFLWGRVNGLLHNQTGNPKLEEAARAQFAAMGETLQRMAATARTPERREKIQQMMPLVASYSKAFDSTMKLLAEQARLRGSEGKLSVDLIKSRADLKKSQDEALAATRAAGEKDIQSTIMTSMVVSAIAVIIGVLLAWFIARGITRPILSLNGVMAALSRGRLDSEIDGADRKDEIGEMARAVVVFRDAGIEKLRLEQEADDQRKAVEAERARSEAAQQEAARQVAQVVEGLGRGLERLASGDLTYRVNDEWAAEYRKIQQDFNGAIAKLQDTIRNIAMSSLEVSNAAAEISTSTTDLSQRTEEQAASLEQTSASMEEIAATVKKNAENAQHANQLAQGTQEIAGRGGAVVAEAVNAMARIEESSRKISEIISVIDEIARQTNLLALNAAVEAARAGEAGRGFAVVASEVRSLAQRSSQAAKDIKDLIASSSGEVREGVELVNRAGQSLEEILRSIKDVADIVADIATASAEQATGIDQVNRALSQMDEVTQQNSALVEENASTAKTLEDQQAAMAQRVGYFRYDTEAKVPAAKPVPVPQRTAA
ncbi:MAG: methyl-accepting chemotaxis protein [Pseudomonadota bacterium]